MGASKRRSSLRGSAAALWLVALGTLGVGARADVKLPALFTDHMVLQRGTAVPVWGWADDGEKVTVEFRGQKASTTAANGKWMLKLRSLKAGGPDTLTVSGNNKIEIKDVLVGEVWIGSGQSNMEWPLTRTFGSTNAIAHSANAQIRLFTVPKLKSEKPVTDVKAEWKLCGPESVRSFSAVAYYFGRDLQKALGVPVGLIHTSWGGSPAEVWMSEDVLAANPDYKASIVEGHAAALKRFQDDRAAYEKEEAELKKEGRKPARNRPNPPYWRPSELYNGMIAPLLPYAIKGAIWYQGESNAGRAHQYRTLFADMIRNWRRDWNNEFTFLTVQLAPFTKIKPEPGESDWAELREAQLLATKVLPKVGLAVITDAGEENDIHPQRKEPVGARLALAARGIAYGEKIVHSGPVYKAMKVKGDQVILSFDHAGRGLEARGGDLTGFSIAGEDRKFVWAKAAVDGKKVVVSSPNVPKPVAVRYGWANFPVVNLWNQDGLPATPFRTDDFPMITAPKK